jgi:hypothetical protein
MGGERMRTGSAGRGLAAAALSILALAVPSSGQVAAPAKGIRFLRSVSGTQGVAKGAIYEITDPRNAFTVPADRQVTVYFEWEGEPGTYAFEGRWKDPTGRVVLVAPTEYTAQTRRFGVRWNLALPEALSAGLWALEVSVDGRAAATHAFSIVAPAAPASLAPADIYRMALGSTVSLQRVGGSGEALGTSAATVVDANHVATSFPTIEGVASIRAALAGGRSAQSQTVRAWSRREGWVVLEVPGHGLTPPTPAGRMATVGDSVFVLEAAERGDFVLRDTRIVGARAVSTGLSLARLEVPATAGSPVLDGGGRILGVVVGGGDVELGGTGIRFHYVEQPLERGAFVMPLTALVEAAGTTPTATVEELGARGVLAKPLAEERRQVIAGVFARTVDRSRPVPMPLEQKVAFSRREGTVSVFIEWMPSSRREASSHFEVYDADNRLLGKSEPNKLKFRPGEFMFSTWVFTIGNLPPGIYRVDALLAESPVWRGHLRITE